MMNKITRVNYSTLKTLIETYGGVLSLPQFPDTPNEVTMEEYARDVLSWIETNCADYIQEHPRHTVRPLWRGFDNAPTDYNRPLSIRPVRTQRRPRDVSREDTDTIDQYMRDKGCIATRTYGVFVTGDYHQARNYGEGTVVYPIGVFNYSWMPDIRDLHITLRDRRVADMSSGGRTDDDAITSLRDPIVRCDDGSLSDAVNSSCEIMIACEQVLVIDPTLFRQYLAPLWTNRFNAEKAFDQWSGMNEVDPIIGPKQSTHK